MQYAFVAHTQHPTSGDPSTMVLEVVPGMGEAIVGAHPGRALQAEVDKTRFMDALGYYGTGSVRNGGYDGTTWDTDIHGRDYSSSGVSTWATAQGGSAGGLGSSGKGFAPVVGRGGRRGGVIAGAFSSDVERPDPLTADASYAIEQLLALPDHELEQLVRITALPSKSVTLWAPGSAAAAAVTGDSTRGHPAFILRSDSNAEDLPGFAGAGLFDSIMTEPALAALADYAEEPAVAESETRHELAWRLAAACCVVEAVLGHPLDIEGGMTSDGRVYILQARPQML